MGVPGSGGSVTTRGGMVFTGFAVDSMFLAFDTATGELLSQADLPGSGMATPMSYVSPRSGRQFGAPHQDYPIGHRNLRLSISEYRSWGATGLECQAPKAVAGVSALLETHLGKPRLSDEYLFG